MTFQHFPVWMYKDAKDKGQPRVIIWTNLVDLESSMQYTMIQPQSFLGFGEDFKVFLPYMSKAAILFNDAEPFEQTGNILLTEGPMWTLLKIAQAV